MDDLPRDVRMERDWYRRMLEDALDLMTDEQLAEFVSERNEEDRERGLR